jgi:hypothetical protein
MPLILAQKHVTNAVTEIVTVDPGREVTFVAAGAVTIGTSRDVTVGSGFTLPDGCPQSFTAPADEGPVTFYGVSAMMSAVSWTIKAAALCPPLLLIQMRARTSSPAASSS